MPNLNEDPSKKTPSPIDPTINPATGKPMTQENDDPNDASNIDSDDKDVGEDEGVDKGAA